MADREPFAEDLKPARRKSGAAGVNRSHTSKLSGDGGLAGLDDSDFKRRKDALTPKTKN